MVDPFERLKSALAGRYTIEREIGAGGMATVYLAHDVKHNRNVALKVLKPDLAAVVGAERFLREIEVTANLQHPHILPLFESGEADGFLFYVMPYVEGDSLRGRLEREGALPIAEATRLIREVADALAYAHSRGVVHRDIKPDNVMVSGRHATVTDFGVARAVSEAAGAAALTTVGMAVGTPAYMSPEQAAADPDIDHRADIYAFGVLAYELLTGAPPFADRKLQNVLAAHLFEQPKPLRDIRPDVGRGLSDVVMRCLSKKPDDRWASADEIVHELEASTTPGTGTTAVRGIERSRTRLGIAALVTIALVAVIGFAVFGRGGGSDPTLSSTSVAVFPFTVQGSADVRYLGEGMVNLLATSMDGAGELRSVDPRAVMARVRQEAPDRVTPREAARLARGLGAGLYVLGDILQAGEGIRIDAALYDQRTGAEPISAGAVDGDPDDILAMVDQIATQLLASGGGRASRVTQVAAVTSASLPALKAYLEGETQFRAGRFNAAVEAFQVAVAADSQFALALYRLSIAAEWALRPDLASVAAEGAVRHADRLSDHDRRILEALLANRRADHQTAERMFRAVVEIWPQDVEAWIQLAEVQFHYGPVDGRPISESREGFERVLTFEPDNAVSLMHLQRIAARAGDVKAVDSLGQRVLQLNPEGDRALEVGAYHAVFAEDSSALLDFRAALVRAPEIYVPEATYGISTWTDRFGALQLLFATETLPSRSPELRALGHIHLAYLNAIQGRWSATRNQLDAAERLNQALGLSHRALLTLQPFTPASRAEVESLRRSLRDWDATQARPSSIPIVHFNVHDGLYPGLRRYLLGLTEVQLGNLPAASALAAQLDRTTGDRASDHLHRAYGRSIRAAVAEAGGDRALAIQLLGDGGLTVNYELALFSPFTSLAAERYRRAVLLDTMGRGEEAAVAYRSFEEFSFVDRVFAGPAALRSARLAEREGRPADARRHYERSLFLWSEADEEFQPMIDEARAGLQRVGG
jgi:serine/threonine-protein kinase